MKNLQKEFLVFGRIWQNLVDFNRISIQPLVDFESNMQDSKDKFMYINELV